MQIKMLKLILPSFSIFHFSFFHSYIIHIDIFIPRYEVYRGYIVFAFSVIMFVCLSVNFVFVKYFSATTWVRILKFCTKLDSDELYCVTKEQPHILLISPFICSFFFSPMEISVTDFSAPIGASVFIFYVHLQEGKVYCVNGN